MPCNSFPTILFILVSVVAVHYGGCELFTALTDMEELLETESVLINNLEGYILAQEKKLEFLKQKVKEYQREHAEAGKDVSSYLLNPINAYLLTKRLTSDWKDLEQIMTMDVGSQFIQNVTNYREVLKFPSEEDLTGAASALIRLQDTYDLNTASLARGELNGVQYSTQMSSEDCFEVGRQMYNNQDYHHTVMWMEEAINRLTNDSRLLRSDVLEYLAFSTFKEGNIKLALEMTNELLMLTPDHQRANGNKRYYEKELMKINEKSVLRGDDGSPDVPVDKSLEFQHSKLGPYTYNVPERKLYELACQGELTPDDELLSSLFCSYVDNGVPFLKIGPLKIEQISHDPYIVVYHDVMYDNEIEIVKKMAKPRFKRATVQNHLTGELEVAHYRISKSAWLKDEEHYVVRNIAQRIVDMTGLTMETAEELQVVNYGIGGHYEPHYDFARKEEINAFKNLNSGNRIATVLFYMSDVTQGGATVFPALKTALWPKKGTAAFWFNLRKSGQGDYMTRHAACPVIVGSKWVANKWIHEVGNEFTRPCGLEIDHDVEF
ncbi:CLUMA_CG008246, isoform A [Clunio marinus]|uniref:procollagen-proline 4-dioxygenase n=1 Tax=Clunio marinus TaxID=568069 RepID=A0A1J1I4Q8_9DIPT|nr:CLUMA_CG008246, isoform A [Clunio marinus]